MINNTVRDKTSLYYLDSCCGCGGCEWICPNGAINMKIDEYGNIYPNIDEEKCISCHLCINNCAYQSKHQEQYPLRGYALVNNNTDLINLSASGGAFSAIAEKCIRRGFFVCGSMMKYGSKVYAEHVLVYDLNSLPQLFGSKYTNSSLKNVFGHIKLLLNDEKKVLFSGLPCQVAQIKKMFSRYSEYLYTIDIICHGAPSQSMFSEYISCLETKTKGKVIDFKFRDKKYGWGKYGSALVKSGVSIKKIDLPQENSSYYSYFMSGTIQRENCFSCPYAKANRCADLTLGDYWGIEKYHPELLTINNGPFDRGKGISAVLVNTEKGMELIRGINATIIESDVSKIVLGNSQLRHPLARGKLYKKVNKAYKKGGYMACERIFYRVCLKRKLKKMLKKYLRLLASGDFRHSESD